MNENFCFQNRLQRSAALSLLCFFGFLCNSSTSWYKDFAYLLTRYDFHSDLLAGKEDKAQAFQILCFLNQRFR